MYDEEFEEFLSDWGSGYIKIEDPKKSKPLPQFIDRMLIFVKDGHRRWEH